MIDLVQQIPQLIGAGKFGWLNADLHF